MDTHPDTEATFLSLYDEYADALYRHCYYRVSNQGLAEDLTQEAFMRVWNYLREGKPVGNPKAFLYRIASNLIIDHYRKKKEASLESLADTGFDPAGDDADTIVAHAEGGIAKKLIDRLDPLYRDVIVLRYIDGLSIAEIANAVGESENVVSVRIHRAVEKLKTLFNHD